LSELLRRGVKGLLGERWWANRRMLQDFGRELADAPLDLRAIQGHLLDRIDPITHSAPAFVFLYDSRLQRYRLHAARGRGKPEVADISFDGDCELAHWLSDRQQPIHSPSDWGRQPGVVLAPEERRALDSLQLALILPLKYKRDAAAGKLGGWVALGLRPSGKPYSSSDVAALAALVDRAAASLEHAQLFADLERRLQEETQQLAARVRQANEAKSEFIDFVAHELKQPMTAMQGYAKMLTLGIGGPLTDRQAEFVRIINSNVERMGRLVNDLLEISRLETGRIRLDPKPVALDEIVEEVVVNIRTEIEARAHTLVVEAPDDLPLVLADRDRLIQILTNLVSNAYKYTPNGGTIRIVVAGDDHPPEPPDHLRISVSDTGIGLSPEELLKLGNKFFRGEHDLVQQQPGTGLGLSITRNLVALHGGEFLVESEPGRGSTFTFTVPIAGASVNL
jgi:signal transduction histidine kinase